jgi:hypothetical protein
MRCARLNRRRDWVEWKVLHHFRSVFSEALDHLPELAHVVAIETRYIAEEALRHGDREVLVLAIRYFNTFLRGASTSGTCAPATTSPPVPPAWPNT